MKMAKTIVSNLEVTRLFPYSLPIEKKVGPKLTNGEQTANKRRTDGEQTDNNFSAMEKDLLQWH